MDKYGYIGIETLLNYCENSKDHAVTPNEFMRMKRVRMAEPHWIPCSERLPEEYGNYLATMDDGDVQECTYSPEKNTPFMRGGWSTCEADGQQQKNRQIIRGEIQSLNTMGRECHFPSGLII